MIKKFILRNIDKTNFYREYIVSVAEYVSKFKQTTGLPLVSDLGEIMNILDDTVPRTRLLLSVKGFQNTIEARVEKYVLLQTEISELADAIKKGLGEQAEKEEIADIMIRACNFLCCDEACDHFYKISKAFKSINNGNESLMLTIPGYYSTESIIHKKYAMIELMTEIAGDINDGAYALMCSQTNSETSNAVVTISNAVSQLASLCLWYVRMFFDANLQDCIDSKMNKNFLRPYQYNSCEEFNK